jgi:hypothetical protein
MHILTQMDIAVHRNNVNNEHRRRRRRKHHWG